MRNHMRSLMSALFVLSGAVASGQGIITTLAGNRFASCGPLGDGGPATSAQLCGAQTPTVDTSGNVFFYDYANARIRKITPDGIITTIAGNGTSGAAGDGGLALSARLGSIEQLAWTNVPIAWAGPPSTSGQLCFGDVTAIKIRCVSLDTGIIQGFGTGVCAYGGQGDGGPLSGATFNAPEGVVFDGSGNLYISDFSDSRVRKVDALSGIITTFAGPGPGYCCAPVGDGGPATSANLYEPGELAYFGGALYIADEGNARVRRVDLTTNLITTVAGNGTYYSSPPDGTLATSGSVSTRSIAIDSSGNLFLGAVRMVDTSGIITTVAGQQGVSGSGSDDVPALQTYFGGVEGIAWDPIAQRLLITDDGDRIRQVFYTPPTTTTLTSSQNPVLPTSSLTLQASVSPADATGSVRFYTGYNGTSQGPFLGSAPVVNGIATISWTAPAGPSTTVFTAVYGGDPTHNLSLSPTVTETGQLGSTTSTLISSVNPSGPGQSVTFTATVTPAAATGTVAFLNGAASIGSATLQNGVAALAITTLPAGSDSIKAVYNGNGIYSGSTAPVVTQTVTGSATTTTLTATPNPSIVGGSVTFVATEAPATATGTVQFLDGATVLGTGTLASGTASFSTLALTQGWHYITAVYSGDANDTTSTSAVVTQVVNAKPTTVTTLTATPNPSTVGASVTLVATVSPASATGTVQFLDGATALATGTLANGTTSFSSSTLAQGAHSITAVYSGDANNAGSTSVVLTQTVKTPTATSVTATPNPSIVGAAVTLTATVSPTTATGTVQFLDGTTVLGTSTLASGTASFGSSTLAQGAHSITSVYSGDANNASSTSAVFTQTVNAKTVTTTSVTATPNPSIVGAAVTLTATVSPTTATGTVQFLDGTTVLGTSTLASGTASFNSSTLAQGAHSITAVYSGDANNASSTSAVFTQTVNAKTVTTTSVTATPNPSIVGAVVTLTATVSPTTATGTVQFLDGTTVLGTGTLASGTASFSSSTLAQAAHSITAVYSGDANNAVSTSGAITQTVNAKTATTTSLATTQNPALVGGGAFLIAQVNPSSVTGSIQFLDGTTVLGTVTLTGNSANFPLSGLALGTHSITAIYSGDANNATSTSAVVSQAIDSDPAMTLTWGPNPSASGQSVTFNVHVNPAATGTVKFIDGSTLLATAPVSSGAASFSTSSLALGVHSITINYSGDTNYLSAGTTATQTVLAASTVAVASSVNPSTARQAVTFAASVTPSSATGTVQFLDSGAVIGTASLASGAASFTTASLAKGTHSISVAYSGDAADAAANSGTLTQVVRAVTSVTAASSLNPVTTGQTVTFTASVTPSGATGSVQFLDGATVLGTGALAGGVASFGTSALAQGTHSITAVYSGDATDAGSTSVALTQTVNAKTVTTTGVTAAPNPSIVGSAVTLTATISPSAATGTVQFLDGAAVLGTVTLANGTASFSISTLAQGTHSF